jgi:hypothetical protein
MKVIYALIVIPLTLVGLIVLRKISTQQPIGSFSILTISALLCLSLLAFFSLLLYRQKKWQTVDNIWLAVASSILTYVVVDLVTGYLLIKPLSPPLVRDQHVHHKLQPNTFSRFQTRDFDYIQRVNNIGLRGRNIDLVKKPTTYRILMLGDSFTMGKGVEDHETFSAVLEQSLSTNKVKIHGKTVQVINAGINSYSPILSFLQLKTELGQLKPDLVVLNFDMSDLIQETAYRNAATYGTDGEIIGVDGDNPSTWLELFGVAPKPKRKEFKDRFTVLRTEIRRWINRHLYITRLLFSYLDWQHKESTEITIENTVALRNMYLLRHTLAKDEADRKEQWQKVFDSLLKVKRYCDDHGMDFLLTVYPWGHQVNRKEWIIGRSGFIPDGSLISDESIRTIEDFAAANKLELLNVFPAFRQYNGAVPLYFNYDMHWTPQGHRLMARELEQFLIGKYVEIPYGHITSR